MVGLTISTMVVVAMFSMYKVTLQVTVTAAQDARADGQTASSLLAAEVLLQRAGAGIENAIYGCPQGSGSDAAICVLDGATYKNNSSKLTGTVISADGGTGNAVIWSWTTNGSYACGMLVYETSYNTGMGGLLYATQNQPCDSDTVWENATVLVLDRTVTEDGNRPFEFILEKKNCKNFGVFGDGPYLLSIAAMKSDSLTSIGSVCLVNISDP
jgi:hypothetical protein